MADPLRVQIPHELGRNEARRRIETGFTDLIRHVPGGARICSEQWEGDRLTFSISSMGQTVAGVLDVLDTTVAVEIELPGFLGKLAGVFRGQLQKAGQVLLLKR